MKGQFKANETGKMRRSQERRKIDRCQHKTDLGRLEPAKIGVPGKQYATVWGRSYFDLLDGSGSQQFGRRGNKICCGHGHLI